MGEEVIGRGTWYDMMAKKVIDRECELGRSLSLVRTEMGLGASGFPHIGSLGDAARSYAVTLALKDMGFNSELVAFCDDKDGLRKVPAGLPKTLEKYLGFPVSSIPDPFGCHESYGKHMSSLLLEALEYFPKTDKILYSCEGLEIRGKLIAGCGHKGEADIARGDGKLSWKSEFAARWKALDIRFEAYGKDIADSVRINDRLCREILCFEPPSP